mgnify:CR=1 FL=1
MFGWLEIIRALWIMIADVFESVSWGIEDFHARLISFAGIVHREKFSAQGIIHLQACSSGDYMSIWSFWISKHAIAKTIVLIHFCAKTTSFKFVPFDVRMYLLRVAQIIFG